MQQHDDQSWTEAWGAAYPPEAGAPTPAGIRPRKVRRGPRTRSVLLATGLLVLGITPFAVGATGDVLREGQRNGTATRETQIIGNIGFSNRSKGGYTTRQSNLSRSGGGAVYGCRSRNGAGNNPCLNAVNLNTGYAFAFTAEDGNVGGVFNVGSGGSSKRPFTTNATAVATNLNADRVDGQDAAQIIANARATPGLNAATVDGATAASLKSRWALVNEAGVIEAQSGGFSILDAYVTNQNVYIDTGSSLAARGLTASIAIRNVGNAPGTTGFDGEVSVARCQIPGVVECAPASAKNVNALVVSPRNSDGTATTAATRKRFYVEVTE